MDNNFEFNNHYDQIERISAGLLAIFPHIDSYRDFIKDNEDNIENFIRLAVDNNIINGEKSGDNFKDYIKKHSLDPYQMKSPTETTLSTVLQEQISSPIKYLIDRINEIIREYDLEDMVPAGKITYSMLSRLQREPANTKAKRNSIRLFCFGYSYLRPDLCPLWNYEKLLTSCPKEPRSDYTHGVRIAFDLYDRDDIIDARTIKWLKNDILDCLDDIIPIQYKKITLYSKGCFYVDIPTEDPSQNWINLPDSYKQCIKQALSMTHQISAQWAILNLRYPNRVLTIGICAGEFSKLDIYARSIIKTRHPVRSRLLISDFTKLCILVNGIQISFKEKQKSIEMPCSKSIISWEIESMLENNPYQLVSYLLDDNFLEIFSGDNFEEISDISDRIKNLKKIINGNNADEIIPRLKYPKNSLLGIELAKTLYYKGKLRDSYNILNFLLLKDPENLLAKINRINILWNSGFSAKSLSVSNHYFGRAEKEASEIDPAEINYSDEFFSQYIISKIGQTVNLYSLLKKGGGSYKEEGMLINTNDLFTPLNEVIERAEKHIFLKPEKSKSLFLMFYVLGLKSILSVDTDVPATVTKDIIDNNFFHKIAEDYFESLDPLTFLSDTKHPDLTKRALKMLQSQDDSIMLTPAVPNDKYLEAALIWDFSPLLNIDVIDRTLFLLKEALESAQKVKEQKLHTISWLRARNEIVSADIFIQQVGKFIKKVKDVRKSYKSINIEEEKSDRLVLFFLNI